MKTGLSIALIALIGAGMFAALASSEPFDERLVRLEARAALPMLADTLDAEPASINALFLGYADEPALWMSARLAILNHGDPARQTLLEHGLEPAFQQALKRYGADAVLPVSYYRDHDIATVRAQDWLGKRYRQVSKTLDGWLSEKVEEQSENDDAPQTQKAQKAHETQKAQVAGSTPLSPHRRGEIAIATLLREGHDFLREFVVGPEGTVTRLQSERLVSDVGDFFTGGVRSLESQWRRGESIGAADIGWAGVDLLVMGSAVKVLRAGRAVRAGAAVEGQGARIAAGDAIAASGRFASLSRTARVAAIAGSAYVIIKHPSLVGALGANVATWLGWPAWLAWLAWLGQFLLWVVVLLPLLIVARFVYRWLLAPLLWLFVPLLRATSKMPRWMVKRQQASRRDRVEMGLTPAIDG